MNNGKITISKPVRGDGLERVEISVKDDLSRNRFVTVSITLENFAHALMGLAEVDCKHELRPIDRTDLKAQAEVIKKHGAKAELLGFSAIAMKVKIGQINGVLKDRS